MIAAFAPHALSLVAFLGGVAAFDAPKPGPSECVAFRTSKALVTAYDGVQAARALQPE